jgi:hypothetical protein
MDMIKSVASNTGTNDFFKPTLKTSKGRSLLDIAMKSRHVGILRYLINEKCVSVYEVADLDLALGAVEALAKSGSSNHELFTGDKVFQNIDKGWKAGACDAEVKVNAEVRRSSATQRSIFDISPKKARIYSHLMISPHREKVLARYS